MIDIVITYIALAIFIIGIIYKIYSWLKSPVPASIGIYQDSTSVTDAIKNIIIDVITFRPILRFKGNLTLWLGAWFFHLALIFTLTGHFAFFSGFYEKYPQVEALRPIFKGFVTVVLPITLIYLLIRRLVHPDMRYISTGADYFALLLLLGIAFSGIGITYTLPEEAKLEIKNYVVGILTFNPIEMPPYPVFWVHYTLVLILLIYFPFSKLMHLFGAWITPTKTSYLSTKSHTKKFE